MNKKKKLDKVNETHVKKIKLWYNKTFAIEEISIQIDEIKQSDL